MNMSSLSSKNIFPLIILALFALTACGGGGGGGGGGSSAAPVDPFDGDTYNAPDAHFGLLKTPICTAWGAGNDLKFVFDDARKGIQSGLVTVDYIIFEAKQRNEFCTGTDDGGFTTADARALFLGGNATAQLCPTMTYGDFMNLTPDTLYFFTLEPGVGPNFGNHEVALTPEQIEIICGGDLSGGPYESGYYSVGEMRAVNLPSDVTRTQPELETLRQSSINLSHLFQRGAMQDNVINSHDSFGNAITFTPLQAQSVKSSYGLSDAMHDLTFSAKRDEVFRNEQANLSFTTNKYDSGQSNLNADYQLGNMFVQADYNPIIKKTDDTQMFLQVSDSARDVGTLRVSHKISDAVSFSQKAGAGTLSTGNHFDEVSMALHYDGCQNLTNRGSGGSSSARRGSPQMKMLAIGAGRLREYDQFLGSVTTGVYALNEATESAFISLHADMNLGKNLTMQANYSAMNSNVSLHHDEFVRVNGLRSDSYNISFHVPIGGLGGSSSAKRGSPQKISLQYLVPLAVIEGTWQQRNVINLQDTITRQDLSVNDRHEQWELRYQSNTNVFATLTRDENYSNIAGLNETRVMAGLVKKF